MSLRKNPILKVDSYKASHFLQYPPGLTAQYAYLEARILAKYESTLFFGLQYYLKEYLSTPITMADVEEAKLFIEKHGLPFPYEGWKKIVTVHGGKLPIEIKAVPEGTVVPVGNVLMTVETTDPELPWLSSWVETNLMRVWYPCTVASVSFHLKKLISKFLDETSDNAAAALPFRLHDFGARGVSSPESAAIGGAAHLVSFMGTDTLEALAFIEDEYGTASGMAGYSIPAAEHSTVTTWERAREAEMYANMVKQFGGPGKILAVVSDSYDLDNAVDNIWGKELKQQVIDSGALVVIRPDSGDPVQVPLRTLISLEKSYGSTVNSKGFKVLNNVRVIQGDGMEPYTIELLMTAVKEAGFSIENIAFGMGGGLLQKVNRDTQRFAYKTSAAEINDKWKGIKKQPKTDLTKGSKSGMFFLTEDLTTVQAPMGLEILGPVDNILQPVFKNGKILRKQTFDQVRAEAAKYL